MLNSCARTGSRPVYLVAAVSSAIACTSRICKPQNSAICSNDRAVLSTSQLAVAWGISGWTTFTLQRSEEHTSELQSLMRISYDVFCLKKKKKNKQDNTQKY